MFGVQCQNSMSKRNDVVKGIASRMWKRLTLVSAAVARTVASRLIVEGVPKRLRVASGVTVKSSAPVPNQLGNRSPST